MSYADCLKANNIQISISRKGNPYDNALVQSTKQPKTKKARSVKSPIKQTECPAEQSDIVEEFLLH